MATGEMSPCSNKVQQKLGLILIREGSDSCVRFAFHKLLPSEKRKTEPGAEEETIRDSCLSLITPITLHRGH